MHAGGKMDRVAIMLRFIMQVAMMLLCFLLQEVTAQTTSSSSTVLFETNLSDFVQNKLISFSIDASQLSHRIVIEVEANLPMTGSSSFELMCIAGEPGVALPDFYSILFQYSNFMKNSTKMHFDVEGFATMRPFQFIEISSVNNQMIGEWTLGLYDLHSDLKSSYNIDVRILDFGSSKSIYCPSECNSKGSKSNSCLGTIGKYCKCDSNYIGSTCWMKVVHGEENLQAGITIPPWEWRVWQMAIRDFSGWTASISLAGTFSVKTAVLFGSESTELAVPSLMSSQTFELTSSSSNQQDYPLSSEDLNKLNRVQTTTTEYGRSILIGFYNLDRVNSSVFSFELKSSEINSDSTLMNQTTVFIFIAFGCGLIFCVTPITYFCMKYQRKVQEEKLFAMFAIQYQQENNNQQQNSASNHSQQQQQQSQSQQPGDQILLSQSISHIQNENDVERTNNRGLVGTSMMNQNSMMQQESQFGGGGGRIELSAAAAAAGARGQNMKVSKKIVPITKETINTFMPKQGHAIILRLYPSLKDEGGEECMVCLEQFSVDSECRITPCFHLFHSDCLESWFAKHSTCPYCRANCNRKGIVSSLTTAQKNSYIMRIQSKILGGGGVNVSKENEKAAQKKTEEGENKRVSTQNNRGENQQAEKSLVGGASMRMMSLAESILNTIKKPVQSLFRGEVSQSFIGNNNNNQQNQFTEIVTQNRNRGNGNNNEENEGVEEEKKSNFVDFEQNPNNMLSIQCLSQNQLIDNPHMLSPISPADLASMIMGVQSPMHHGLQDQQEIGMFSLNNSLQEQRRKAASGMFSESDQNENVIERADCDRDGDAEFGDDDDDDGCGVEYRKVQSLDGNAGVFDLKGKREGRDQEGEGENQEGDSENEESRAGEIFSPPDTWRDRMQQYQDNSFQMPSTRRKMCEDEDEEANESQLDSSLIRQIQSLSRGGSAVTASGVPIQPASRDLPGNVKIIAVAAKGGAGGDEFVSEQFHGEIPPDSTREFYSSNYNQIRSKQGSTTVDQVLSYVSRQDQEEEEVHGKLQGDLQSRDGNRIQNHLLIFSDEEEEEGDEENQQKNYRSNTKEN